MTYIVNAKFIQRLCNLNFFIGVEKSSCELFTLAKRAFNDLETGNIAHGLREPRIVIVRGRGMMAMNRDILRTKWTV